MSVTPFFFFRKLCRYETMWKNTPGTNRPHMTIWRMRNACCLTKAINTHSEYVILIPLPPQRWLHERVSVLRYSDIACLVVSTGSGNFLVASTSHRTIEEIRHVFHNLSAISFQCSLKIYIYFFFRAAHLSVLFAIY